MNKKIYCFFAVACLALTVYGQPGGVGAANLRLWVRSNTGISTTGGLVDAWTYANDGTKSFTSTGTERPALTANGLNFQPVLTFAGNQLMDGPAGANAPLAAGDDDYTAFVVWRSSSVNAFQRVWSQRDFGGASPHGFSLATWNDGTYGDQVEVSPYNHTIQRPYSANIWNFTQVTLLNQAAGDLEIVDDRNYNGSPLVLNTDPSGTPNGALLRVLGTQLNRIGARDAAGQEGLLGDVAEIIVYDRPVTTTERAQIFSYFALKYGLPIQTNIVNSTGAVVWDATANSVYNNDVFGIGRDNTSGLLVTSSNSFATGSGTGAGVAGQANIVISNPSALGTDLNFLLVGNDNGSLTETTADLPASAAGSRRLIREWRAQQIGSVGTFNFSIDLTGLPVSGGIGNVGDFRLLIDTDGDANFTTGTPRFYAPSSFTGNVANFTGVSLNNNEVFTLITQAAVGTPLPVTWRSAAIRVSKDDVYLDWEVANNEKGQSYVIEHSTNGVSFTAVGNIANITSVKKYSFAHNDLAAGQHYYRIRQIDLDGSITFSRVLSGTIKGADFIITLQNNPVRGNEIQLEIKAGKTEQAVIEVWSASGSRVLNRQQAVAVGINNIRIPAATLSSGNYIIKVKVRDVTETTQLIKL